MHHDNARVHQTKDIQIFLQEQGIMTIFWLFGYLKRQLDSYSDSKSLQQAVTKAIRAIPQDEYRKTFNKWIERMQLCIANKGEYFEHLMK